MRKLKFRSTKLTAPQLTSSKCSPDLGALWSATHFWLEGPTQVTMTNTQLKLTDECGFGHFKVHRNPIWGRLLLNRPRHQPSGRKHRDSLAQLASFHVLLKNSETITTICILSAIRRLPAQRWLSEAFCNSNNKRRYNPRIQTFQENCSPRKP